jgi:hypothetical protein
MSAPEPMPSARRHPIPGMTKPATTSPAQPPEPEPLATGKGVTDQRADDRPLASAADGTGSDPEGPRSRHPAETTDSRRQWPATDYAATRLANFRIPVALLDRYRHLVREAEDRDPRLRRPSVTEVVIGLLQEGPATPEEVAELIRRKRAAEHGLEG